MSADIPGYQGFASPFADDWLRTAGPRRHSHFTIPPSYHRAGPGNITTTTAASAPDGRRRLSLNLPLPPPPNFSPEDQAYLQARLPLRQPASAATAADHFRRLPSLYQDLAEGCRARLARLPAGGREWARRRRMADLAQRLAERYRGFALVLPRSYVDEAIARWRGSSRARAASGKRSWTRWRYFSFPCPFPPFSPGSRACLPSPYSPYSGTGLFHADS